MATEGQFDTVPKTRTKKQPKATTKRPASPRVLRKPAGSGSERRRARTTERHALQEHTRTVDEETLLAKARYEVALRQIHGLREQLQQMRDATNNALARASIQEAANERLEKEVMERYARATASWMTPSNAPNIRFS
eukprot:4055005-Lingulodinium_polyedra.AAC.3